MLAALPLATAPAQDVRPASASVLPTGEDTANRIPLNFQGAPVSTVVEYYARLTNRTVISPQNIGGQIYLSAHAGLSREEEVWAIESVLAINGVGLVPLGDKFLKVVLIAGAKQEGVNVGILDAAAPVVDPAPAGALPPADSLVTRIIPLKFAEAADVVATLQPYLHAYGQLVPLTKSNSILVTETAGNLKQMLEIIRFVDQPSQLRMETKVYVLQNARAPDVVQQVQSILQQTEQIGAQAAAPVPVPGQPPRPPTLRRVGIESPATVKSGSEAESVVEGKVVITADERTNKIFLLSRASNFSFFDRLIDELDSQIEPDVMTRVIALEYASAEDVAALLNSLISGAALPVRSRTATPGQPPAPPASPVASAAGAGESTGLFEYAAGVRILPDTRTNSLLIMASRNDLERIELLIRNVDTPVAQVLVEVIIAEVNLDNTTELAVNALKRKFGEGDLTQGGASLNRPGDPVDLQSLTTNLLPLASSGLTWFMTFNSLKLDTVIRALATSSRFKVLSTPIIQTLHNQEASIIVGESRPVITSTVGDVVGSNSTAVRSNVEFKDIAIELTVTPRINPDGRVTMEILQKVNDVGGEVQIDQNKVPIITKREAKSSVSVRDGNTIVLGGLIREDKTVTETKTPILGDIPLVGMLFKGKSTTKRRTELVVFIRPTVLRTDDAAMAEARRRSEMLKAGQELELEKVFAGEALGSPGEATSPATGETNSPPTTPTAPEPEVQP